ncbi:MAG: hypothetical protein B7Z37_03060 [Verrucomicrobia bacterium 12-59-8]|nr:MAG: hypothetical protein B7Z37_03060 [Verrucomicrobia bacterium 12-59-8]
MRVLVCGGRTYWDKDYLFGTLDALYAFEDKSWTEIIQGGAMGADTLAFAWATKNKIPCRVFHADWKQWGKAAGHIRNTQMLVQGKPDLVIAFPGGKGTANMCQQAIAAGVRVLDIVPET